RVLVVEDNPNRRDLIAASLKEYGAEASVCDSATIGALGQWRPDILVSDIKIAGQERFKLISKVSDLEAARGTAIVTAALPAYAGVKYWMRSLPDGCQLDITSPVEPADLVMSIVKFAKRSGLI